MRTTGHPQTTLQDTRPWGQEGPMWSRAIPGPTSLWHWADNSLRLGDRAAQRKGSKEPEAWGLDQPLRWETGHRSHWPARPRESPHRGHVHGGDRAPRSSCPGTSPKGSPITTHPPFQPLPHSFQLCPWQQAILLVNKKCFSFSQRSPKMRHPCLSFTQVCLALKDCHHITQAGLPTSRAETWCRVTPRTAPPVSLPSPGPATPTVHFRETRNRTL